MRLSVIIPVYNAEKTLDAAVSSALCVTEEMELILVDDGSKDGSFPLMEAWAQKDARVRIFQQPNGGCGAARNRGLQEARGEYIAFVDADDLIAPEGMGRLLQRARAEHAQMAIGRGAFFETDPGRSAPNAETLNLACVPHEGLFAGREMGDRAFHLTSGVVWGTVYEHRFLREHGLAFSALRRTEDVPFTFTAMALAERIMCLDEVVYLYCTGTAGSMEHQKDEYPDAPLDAVTVLREELHKRGVMEHYRAALLALTLRAMNYNLHTLQRGESCLKLLDRFLEMQNLWGVGAEALTDPLFKVERRLMEQLLEAGSGANYLYQRALRAEKTRWAVLESRAYRLGRKLTALPARVKGWLK